MTPEAGLFLDKARKMLAEAEAILAINLCDVAGRTTYLAEWYHPTLLHQVSALRIR